MIENLQKNGSFIERKKLFVQLPFHSLNHHAPFQWPEDRSSQEKVYAKKRPSYEKEYIRRIYNERVQQKLHERFNAPLDTFRAIPNQITAKRDEEALNKQIQHFNCSKMTNNNPESLENFNENKNFQRNYQSAQQIKNKPSLDQLYYPPHLYSNRSIIYGPRPQKSNEGARSEHSRQKEPEKRQFQQSNSMKNSRVDNYREQKPDFYRGPYIRRNYGPQSLQNYQSYADLINQSNLQPPAHPLRNYQPDRLEGYLRENLRVQRKRPINSNLSLQNRLKI